MTKIIVVALLALVVGLGLGTFFGGGLIGAVGGFAGAMAGAQVGVCQTVKTAQANGLLTQEQAGKLLTDAVAVVRRDVPQTDASWVSSLEDCNKKK
ncbi:MAG: hypothetical protein GEU91_24795 [Rhizobiales bacterium]|nr:hypothetical protein [Hyphomicrobiales bacterium]